MPRSAFRVESLEDRLTPSGGLDASFGTGGAVVTTITGGNDGGYAVAVQPDGKVVVAGAINDPAATPYIQNAIVLRYNPDGTPDATFGTAGRVVFGTNSFEERWNAVALQPDGKIVVGGRVADVSGSDFLVARYNADGTPDSFFGTGGATTVDFGTSADFLNALAILPNGTIYAVGDGSQGALPAVAVARLQPDGLLDATYNGTGKVQARFKPTGQSNATAAALQADGKLVVAGFWSESGVGNDAALGRFNADGTWDATFGAGGTVFADFGGSFELFYGVAIQADGRVVGAGLQSTTADGQFALARVTATGVLDAGFGTGGKVLTNMGGNDGANAVVIQADGKVIAVGGTVTGGTTSQIAVARHNPDGTLDPTFGTGGRVLTQVNGSANNYAFAAALTPAGRLVVAGHSEQADYDITFARYLTNDPPTAVAGGPYTITAGAALALTAAGSADPDGDALVYSWDINGDGVFGDAVGVSPVVSAAALTALTPSVVSGSQVRVQVSDGSNPPVVSAATTLTLIPPLSSGGPTRNLVVGGVSGSAVVFAPGTGGAFATAPAATLAPFGGIAATIRTATADVNGDGTPDTVLVTGPGTPIRVAVVSGTDNVTVLVAPFDPFGGNFTGGGYVAAANLDGVGGAEFVVTPDEGGGPRVTVFSRNPDGSTVVRANFLGIDDDSFRGGARAALGDVNRDGTPDVVVAAGFGGGPRTAVFTGQSVLAGSPSRLTNDFFAFPGTDAVNLRNGTFVAAGDVTGDGFADLIFGGGPGGAPRVFILSGALVSAGNIAGAQAAPVANFFVAGNSADRGGVRVTTKDADGDARADVAVGSGEGSAAKVRVYLGANLGGGGEPGTFQDITVFGGGALAGGVFVG